MITRVIEWELVYDVLGFQPYGYPVHEISEADKVF